MITYIAIGEGICKAIENGDFERAERYDRDYNDPENTILTEEFDTEEEKNEYLENLKYEDFDGWPITHYREIEPEEMQAIMLHKCLAIGFGI